MYDQGLGFRVEGLVIIDESGCGTAICRCIYGMSQDLHITIQYFFFAPTPVVVYWLFSCRSAWQGKHPEPPRTTRNYLSLPLVIQPSNILGIRSSGFMVLRSGIPYHRDDAAQQHTRQHTATPCNTLQRTATHYNTSQHSATICWDSVSSRRGIC